MVRYLCEITTHKGQASTHLHHLVLLNKEKQEPKKVVTEKLLLNYSKWLRYGSLHYLCAVMAGFEPANLQRDKLAS